MAERAMSTMSLRSKINEDHLTCTICYDPFDKPKALPCLHTFCQDCLRDFITSRGFEEKGVFQCPVCRIDVDIPNNGVQGFPDNYLIESLRDTVAKKATPPPRPSKNPVGRPTVGGERIESPSNVPGPGQQLYPTVPQSTSVIPTTETQSNIPCGKGMLFRFGSYGTTLHDFRKPYGLAVGKKGEFVVTDLAGSRVLVYSSTGILLARFGCECKIAGVAMTRTNHVLVAVHGSGDNQAIMREYNFDGKLLARYGDTYKFDKPSGITVTDSNQVAITNLEGHSVLFFTELRKFSKKFGWKGAGDHHFNYPQFIASNSKNNIIVSDSGNDCVKVFNSDGEFKRRIGESGDKHGCFSFPMGVAIDSDDHIIVCDAGNFRVEVFTRKGLYVKTIVEDTDQIGEDVKPLNVAVSGNKVAVLFSGPQFAEIRVYAN